MKNMISKGLRKIRPLVLLVLVYGLTFLAAGALPEALLVNLAPWQAGVRQNNFGGGLETQDLPPGSHFELPGLSAIQAVDIRGRLTRFSGEDFKHVDESRTFYRPALGIRTDEGQTAKVVVAATWHIMPGEAHTLVAGAMLMTLEAKVADRLESGLRLRLAAFSSGEWFDSRRRAALATQLLVELAPDLEPLFVVLDGIYIQGVHFSSSFEEKLQEKQVSHQMALLHEVGGRVQKAKAEVGKLTNETAALEAQVLAEWNQRRETAKVAFDLEQAILAAETDSFVKGLKASVMAEYKANIAAGEEAIALAKNEGERLRLDALASEGGRVWLAIKAAENLDVKEVWLDSRDPKVPSMLDLDELVGMLFGSDSVLESVSPASE